MSLTGRSGQGAKKDIYEIFGSRNFKYSLIALLFFILLDIPFSYLEHQTYKAGQPQIAKWESTFETITMLEFILIFMLFVIINFSVVKKLRWRWVIAPAIAFWWTFAFYIIIFILNFSVLYRLFT